MNVYRSLENLPRFERSIITIGSFDGVHTGHQKILFQLTDLAAVHKIPTVVITFEPHPRYVLAQNDNEMPKLITSLDEKIRLIESHGIDNVVVVPFTKAFSEQSAETYLKDFLIRLFNPAFIVIGYDHRFGTKRSGDLNFLKSKASEFNYQVIEIEKHVVQSIEISSTKIRSAIEKADIVTANKLLGYFFTMSGVVVEGQKIGREIGFPTANIEITEKHKIIPPFGIYAVYVWVKDVRYRGMLYRGDRPVLKEHSNITLEVNIFDFKQNIYGENIRIEIVAFLRPDKPFTSLEQLVVQLADDEVMSRDFLTTEESKKNARVAIVILNYNTPQFLKEYLPYVCESEYRNIEIFVADNGSTDNSIEALREINLDGIPAANGLDKIKLIELKTNYGFAKGYNLALKDERLQVRSKLNQSGFDYYAIINSDVKPAPSWLTHIVNLFETDTTIAAIQPKVQSFDKRKTFEYAGASGGYIDALGYPFARGRIFDTLEKDKKQYESVEEIFWATGAAIVVRADLWHAFEGFDENFWAHMEEIDFCWRLKRAGYKIMVQPLSRVRHVGGGTLDYLNPKKTYLNFRNSLFALYKNNLGSNTFFLIVARMFLDYVAAAKFLISFKIKHVAAIFKAQGAFISQLSKLKAQKKHDAAVIEKNRIAPNSKKGMYRGSIIWAYYIQKKKLFSELSPSRFF